jgi:hypothetical protein
LADARIFAVMFKHISEIVNTGVITVINASCANTTSKGMQRFTLEVSLTDVLVVVGLHDKML